MKRLFIFSAAVLSAMVFFTCDAYEFPASPFLRVETMTVENITADGVTFSGKITQSGTTAIVDHGFLWGFTSELSMTNAEKIQLGEFQDSKVFKSFVKYGLYKDTTYYLK